MITKICGFLITVMASVSVYANVDSNIREVESQALKFAESVACGAYIKDTKEFPSTKRLPRKDTDDSKYIVWWHGDWGCAGGSKTSSNYLTIVEQHYSLGSRTTPLVENFDILDEVNENTFIINSRFIEDVDIRNDGAIIITSSRLIEGDSLNFPTKHYRYTLQRIAQQEEYGVTYNRLKWQVTNTKYLGSN